MSSARRGRPRNFDEGAVLDRAVNTFWVHGTTGTTTRVLEAELGMAQSSIYNTFGSKDQLLHRALDRYLEQVRTRLVQPLLDSGPSVDGIVCFVNDLIEWIDDEQHPGCLMLNIASDQGEPDSYITQQATGYRRDLRQAFDRALASTDGSGHLVLAAVLGLNLAAAGRATRSELDGMALSLIDYLESVAA